MAPIWKSQGKLVYENWCLIIIAEAWKDLTDWEQKFVAAMEIELKYRSGDLTEFQAKKLEQIYAEKTK